MDKLVKVYSTADSVDLELVLNLLLDNNIIGIKREYGSGEYMNIYMGISMFEKEILVNEKDYKHAREIIKELKIADYEDVEELNTQVDNYEKENLDLKEELKAENFKKRSVGVLTLMIFFIIPILFIIFLFILL